MSVSPRPRSTGRRRRRREHDEQGNNTGLAASNEEGPYLTHVRYHLGQQTLVPPENMGRVRKGRSKTRSKQTGRQDGTIVSSPSPSVSRAVTPSGTRGATADHPRARRQRRNNPPTIRNVMQGHQSIIPAEPPPSFEEVMRQDRNSPLPPRPQSMSAAPSSRRSPSIISLSSNEDNNGSHPDIASDMSPSQISQWERDLRAGFSLEERVKREWERRHAETIPVPVLMPDHHAISVRQSPQQIGIRSHVNPDAGADHSHNSLNDALACESDWELVERDVGAEHASPPTSNPGVNGSGTSRKMRRKPPTPPPPLPRSYVSVQDRVRKIEARNSLPGGTSSIKRRRTPPPIPPPNAPKPRGKDSEDCISAQGSPLPRSDVAFPAQGVITQVHAIRDTATTSSSILKDFDPLLSPTPLSVPEGPINAPAEDFFLNLSDREEMISPNRPLPPPPPTSRPLSVVTAFDELRQRQRRRAVTVGSAPPPVSFSRYHSTSSPGSPPSSSSPSPPGVRRDRRRNSVLSVANPDPAEEVEEEEEQLSRAALLERNHSLNRAPALHDEVTELDVMVSRLSMDGTSSGDNYDAMLLIGEVLGPARPAPNSSTALEHLSIGKVEIERRRVTKDGRIKLKLSLLGVPVERCTICYSQFKESQTAVVLPNCRHCFHEKCIIDWVRSKANCPVCRAGVSPDA